MNDSTSFVFKSSVAQIKLALSMDKEDGGSLSGEDAFFNGTYKRCL